MSVLDSIIKNTQDQMQTQGILKPTPEEARAAHLQQVRRDEEALRRAGFEVEPTVVPWGMAVNVTGVENARLKREEWENLPTVQEAAQGLLAEVEKEDRRSLVMSIANLTVDPVSGKIRRVGASAAKPGLTVTPAAWNNLMAMLAASARRLDPEGPDSGPDSTVDLGVMTARRGWFPASAGAYIGSLPPAWRAEQFDRLKRLANGREVTLKILHVGGDREKPLLYAVTSDRYTDFGAHEVASAFLDAAASDAGTRSMRASVMYMPGTRVAFRASAHSNVDASSYVAGEIFSAGVTIQAWENKGGGVVGFSDFERNKCLNLIVLQHGQLRTFRLRHMGEKGDLAQQVLAGIYEAQQNVQHFVERWGNAWGSSSSALDVLACARRMTAAYDGAKKSQAILSVPGVDPPMLLDWILEGYQAEPHESRAGLVNALSRVPQVATASSPAQAILIQDILADMAGRVLEMPTEQLVELSRLPDPQPEAVL